MIATDLLNRFTSRTYPPTNNGRSEVPLEDIYSELREIFPAGWEIDIKSAGVKPDGYSYVLLTLTVRGEDNFSMTVPGGAEASPEFPFGVSGVVGMAVRNAVLRHLGMGEELYLNRPETSVTPTAPLSKPGPGSHPPSAGRGGWDGSKHIKSGKFANTPWNAVPDRSVEFMATVMSPPNKDAVQEWQRRQNAKASQPASADPFQQMDF